MNNEKNMRIKPYEELNFRDDFMFGKTMEDRELCREVLECLLQHPVGELTALESQREFRYSEEGKPIRLDICSQDENTVYDAEMQNQGHKSVESLELPKRSRFYQSSIDTDYMNRGFHYKNLPESVILFICTFDPFGKGLGKYTFREKYEENSNISLDEGTIKVFFNCAYKGEDIPGDLRQLYDYIETGRTSNDLTERLDNAVCEARKREEWRSAYMKEMVLLMDAKEDGREEGREEGRKEGREEGRKEERINTEVERKRADQIQKEFEDYKTKNDKKLAEYISKFGEI